MKLPFRIVMMSFIVLASAAASYSIQSQEPPRRSTGAPTAIGEGTAWTWVEWGRDGALARVGVSMSPAAFRGLPTDGGEACCGGHEYVMQLPAETAGLTPFTHVVVNWNPKGHEPVGVYDVPHFDFHFYTMSESDRAAIKESHSSDVEAARPPGSECLPTGYVQAPGIVGRMGCHWVDPTSPEFNGKPFTHTFIYGSYNGAVNFVEPMITKAFLESKTNVSVNLPQPQRAIDSRFQPAAYQVEHDAATGDVSIAMSRVK